jgi:hypothetical protein
MQQLHDLVGALILASQIKKMELREVKSLPMERPAAALPSLPLQQKWCDKVKPSHCLGSSCSEGLLRKKAAN